MNTVPIAVSINSDVKFSGTYCLPDNAPVKTLLWKRKGSADTHENIYILLLIDNGLFGFHRTADLNRWADPCRAEDISWDEWEPVIGEVNILISVPRTVTIPPVYLEGIGDESYDASITPDGLVVGCEKFSWEEINYLIDEIGKYRTKYKL